MQSQTRARYPIGACGTMAKYNGYFEKLYREMYNSGLERREKIEASISLPASMIVIFSGVLWFYSRCAINHDWDGWCIAFCVLCSLLFVALLFATYFLIRTLFNYGYGYILSPGQVWAYGLEVRKHYRQSGQSDVEGLTEKQVRAVLRGQYIEAGETNWRNNVRKSGYRHKMYTALVIAVFLFLVSLPPFLVLYSETHGEVQRVEVLNWPNREEQQPDGGNVTDGQPLESTELQ